MQMEDRSSFVLHTVQRRLQDCHNIKGLKLMQLTHAQAEQRYGQLRTAAIDTAQRSIDAPGFLLSKITGEAIAATKTWDKSAIRKYHWDWTQAIQYYRMNYPKRFEVALWYQTKLAGISIGRPTYNATGLRLDVVEASPRDLGPRPKVFDKIILAYEIYARMLKANHIRIMNPVNNTVKAFYEGYGYTYVQKGDYLTRDIL